MSQWKEYSFSDAVQINPSVPINRGELYSFVDMASIFPSLRDVSETEKRIFGGGGSRFHAKDTLMARITPCLENGKIARYLPRGESSNTAFGSTEFIVIRGKEGVTDNDFAYYLAKWDLFRQFAISQMSGSSGRQRVPTDALSKFIFLLPPLPIQQRIAVILGTLDEKIELNRRSSAVLEQMAQALFKSWFVDFDPVYANAAVPSRKPSLRGVPLHSGCCGRDETTKANKSRNEGVLAVMTVPPHIAQLFPKEFEESTLGPIPKGWRVCSLTEISEVNPTRSLSKKTLAPYLDMANMPTQGAFPQSWIMREFGSGMKFINGDTLIARITPCLENGKTAYVDFLEDGTAGWGSTEYIVLRPKGLIPPQYAYLLARSNDFRAFAIRQMTGSSGRQRVPSSSLENYEVVSPEIDFPLYQHFGEIISPMFDKMKIEANESRTLSALRDTLLPKLMSGELLL